ncbi:chloramphenicol resistance protein [Clostridium celatum]|uniref:chloramphenicol resistance protein n=1 Tax=Clostridium celatum TaxID=36834 RepID=UPI001F2730AA|nr:chloramphenicol resistance protein [Clostridium celatum]MCE9656518.1 chloramphenicol resistance protein [Clostridium celatum]
MIIESLKDYISTCPYLYEFNKEINVDYLDDDSTTYSIEEVPCEPIIKKYLNGDTKRQYDFIFASRESYGPDVFQNIENSGFYEDFASWIEEESFNNNLPDLGEGREPIKIEVSTTGYAFQTDINQARYQIQLKLIYFQRRR